MKSLFENLFGKKPPQAAKRIDHSSATPLQQPTFAPYKKGDLIGGKYYVHGVLGAGGFGIDELNPCLFAKFCCQTFSLRGGTPDLRSDVYAFGLVLWQMVTGSLMAPFVAEKFNSIIGVKCRMIRDPNFGKAELREIIAVYLL